MQKPEPMYAVTVEARLPEFDTERLFVINEQKFAQREVERLEQKHSLIKAALPLVGSPGPKEWKHYIHQLDQYWANLNEHMAEIGEGLVPLKFFVVNTGPQLDTAIKIRVTVESGTIHPMKIPPQRPQRVDNGPQHTTEWTPARRYRSLAGLCVKVLRFYPTALRQNFRSSMPKTAPIWCIRFSTSKATMIQNLLTKFLQSA
jgi:hypothetical protein